MTNADHRMPWGSMAEARAWLDAVPAVRYRFVREAGGDPGIHIVIRNPDGSDVVARLGDTLVYDNGGVSLGTQ